MSYAVEIQHLSKRFRLYQEKYSSLKERVVHAGHIPYDEFWALHDVDAAFESGHTIGMLGRNGSGKSTLLKCVAGILQPTSGQVVVRGRIAAMLELGAGFEADLSGRDNVFLNGTLLGMSRKEIRRRFDEIVAFAELEQFIDNQVKYYSSGMVVRLGFAVAISMEPDVLLVDEVLAVGDERFQQKCLERVKRLQQEGRTIVVVSHAADMLRELCSAILVLDHGEAVSFGPPGEAIRAFREGLLEAGEASSFEVGVSANHRQVEITGASVDYPGSGDRPYAVTGEPLTVHLDYLVRAPVDSAQFEIEIYSDKSGRIYLNRTGPEDSVTLAPGVGSISFRFDAIPLLDGRYTVNLAVRNAGGIVLAIADPACAFEVMNPGRSLGVVDLPMRVELSAPGELRDRSAI
jgi:ABC-type polysaccharide/polyol phosphate transport system ATPase subunit